MSSNVTYHQRRLNRRLQDSEFREHFEQAKAEIEQIDEVIRALDDLRVELGISKAELARRIGKNAASIRRLFTSESNPELGTVAAIANALNARLKIEPSVKRRRPRESVAV